MSRAASFASASKADINAASIAAKAENRAWRNQLAGIIATDIPDPVAYALDCPAWVAEALLGASFDGESQCWVSRELADELRPYGLVEFGGRCLTAFGLKVRWALRVDAERGR